MMQFFYIFYISQLVSQLYHIMELNLKFLQIFDVYNRQINQLQSHACQPLTIIPQLLLNLKKALSKGRVFGSEGLAINISVYVDGLETEFLPPSCNWIINHLLPKYDEDNQQFVEPNLPNNRIGIMHLAGGYFVNDVDIREDKSIEINLQTLNDSNVFKSLRFNIGKI